MGQELWDTLYNTTSLLHLSYYLPIPVWTSFTSLPIVNIARLSRSPVPSAAFSRGSHCCLRKRRSLRPLRVGARGGARATTETKGSTPTRGIQTNLHRNAAQEREQSAHTRRGLSSSSLPVVRESELLSFGRKKKKKKEARKGSWRVGAKL